MEVRTSCEAVWCRNHDSGPTAHLCRLIGERARAIKDMAVVAAGLLGMFFSCWPRRGEVLLVCMLPFLTYETPAEDANQQPCFTHLLPFSLFKQYQHHDSLLALCASRALVSNIKAGGLEKRTIGDDSACAESQGRDGAAVAAVVVALLASLSGPKQGGIVRGAQRMIGCGVLEVPHGEFVGETRFSYGP